MVAPFKRLAVPQQSTESRQIRQFGGGSYASGWFGCPIGQQQEIQIPTSPERCSYNGKEAFETVLPAVHERKAAHQQVNQQAHPYLPAHRIGAATKEVAELQGLLDFLEEHLNVPAAPVKLGNGPCAPLKVIGHEDHLDVRPVDFHHGGNSPQRDRVGLLGLFHNHFDEFIAQDALVAGCRKGANHAAVHVVLGSADPPYTPSGKFIEVVELRVGLVKNSDFTALELVAEALCLRAVMLLCRVDNHTLRKKALQVEPQVALGGRLPAAVFRPVHAVGNQLDRGRVHRVNGFVEAPEVSAAHLALGKPRNRIHQVLHHTPVKFLGHVRIANPVGVTEVVARWRHRPPYRRERGRIHLQGVTHIIEPKRMSQMRIKQRDRMAPRRKATAPGVDTMLVRKARNQVPRNQIAHLLQCSIPMSGWLLILFLHVLRVEDFNNKSQLFL